MQRKIGSEIKAKVALEALRGEATQAEISSRHGVHATQINRWRKQVLEELPLIFSSTKEKVKQDQRQLVEELYKQIGQLKVENEWLKKKSSFFEY